MVGGNLSEPTVVTEQYLLNLEEKLSYNYVEKEKTHVQKGKPLQTFMLQKGKTIKELKIMLTIKKSSFEPSKEVVSIFLQNAEKYKSSSSFLKAFEFKHKIKNHK